MQEQRSIQHDKFPWQSNVTEHFLICKLAKTKKEVSKMTTLFSLIPLRVNPVVTKLVVKVLFVGEF